PAATRHIPHPTARVRKTGKTKTPLIAAAAVAGLLGAAAAGYYFLGGSDGSGTGEPTEEAAAGPMVTRTIVIQSDRGGAEVWGNGQSTGLFVPAELQIEEPAGSDVYIELKRGEHVVASRTFTVDPAMATDWTAVESALPAQSYEVATRPNGATIFVNDEATEQKTPAKIDLVPGQEYKIRVELAEHHPEEVSFEFPGGLSEDIRDNEQVFFRLRSTIPPGKLQLAADYSFRVKVGGRSHGPSKSHSISLRPDTYEAQLTSAEVFLDTKRQVTVRAGEAASVEVPAAVDFRVAANPGNCRVYINDRLIGELPVSQSLIPGTYRFRFEWPASGETREKSETITTQTTQVFGTLE
ncbi:MAG: PEGA domain-containing protein, partial [Acidobacteriota bacterium]|nr:PEGA domain-containing protein [Acidobacteriota bacterium]